MMVGATKGMYKALEKMGTSNGGQGGRIVNTASIAGLAVNIQVTSANSRLVIMFETLFSLLDFLIPKPIPTLLQRLALFP